MRTLVGRVENFIAQPQCERSYEGDFAVGFEMRRDTPMSFGPGIWFSDAAVAEILAELKSAKPTAVASAQRGT